MASTLETRSVYRTVQTIASGGMGRVDLVVRREGSFARAHALKRLHPELASNGTVRAMILDEARIAGLVRHANVVSVLDVGEDDEGPFLLMELVEGLSLSRLIASAVERSELLPLQICMEIARQIAEGLHAAHELHVPGARKGGVVHADVSPSNVLLGFDGGVRVTDFGIARALDRTASASGALIGKPGYLAPEQIANDPIDPRSDLFALGVVLFEMLAGRRLYRGETEAVLRRIAEEPPLDIGDVRRDVPPELAELLFELLAKDPEARPTTAAEVSRRLGSVLAGARADEGPLELASFLVEHHAMERAAWRDLLERALEDSDATAHELATPEVLEVHDAATLLSDDGGVLDARPMPVATGRSRTTLLIALGAGVLSLGIGAALVALALSDSEPPPPTVIVPARVGPAIVATEGVSANEPAPADEQDSSPTDGTPLTAPAPTAPAEPSPRRRRGRARRARSTDSEAPTWGWE